MQQIVLLICNPSHDFVAMINELFYWLQVFDRLGHLGISIRYESILDLIEDLKENGDVLIMRAIKSNLRIQICGDNINFWVKVRNENRLHHSHIEHYFGSIVLGHDLPFQIAKNNGPQRSLEDITAADVCPVCQKLINRWMTMSTWLTK